MKKYLMVGGAGFIGSHFVNYLLNKKCKVVVYDNLSSGNLNFFKNMNNSENISFIIDDIRNWEKYKSQLLSVETIIHLASNADIAAAMTNPTIDFYNGTELTQYVAEVARILDIKKIFYASGSGVYGDYGSELLEEGLQELKPISPYGASKLAGESLLRAYSHMYGIQTFCFRFGNVVGKNQTHGIGYDLKNKLRINQKEITMMGNGLQSKSYIHVTEVIDAVMHVNDFCDSKFDVFNISTNSRVSVKEIVNMALDIFNIDKDSIKINYSESNRGWSGDVPVVNLSTYKINKLGWNAKMTAIEAVSKSLWELSED